METVTKRYRWHLVGLIVCLIANIWLRWPATQTNGFHNEDVAGIAYSAQLLHQGGLPLIDTLELKAPGSFFLAALTWSVAPMTISALQCAGVLWSIFAIIGIFFGGWRLFGPNAGIFSSILYLCLAPIVDSMDVNYGAWMIVPYIWSFNCFVCFVQTRRSSWLVGTGILLALAGILKRQGAVLTPLYFIGLLLVTVHKEQTLFDHLRITAKTSLPLIAGLALGFCPILIFYLYHGELLEFIHHYFFSPGGWKYLDTLTWSEKAIRLNDGVLGFFEYGATATVLAFAGLVSLLSRHIRAKRQSELPPSKISWFLVAGLLGVSLIGLTMGFRFFKGYYLQTLPALVWMASATVGVSSWFTSLTSIRTRLGITLLLVSVIIPFAKTDWRALKSIRHQRHTARDLGVQRIAADIKANTTAEERIWVWGRAAWPIYVHANRLAATRYPKTLAVFTTNLTNTWRRGTKPTTFDPRTNWKQLIKELKRDKPSYIVLAHNERYGKFIALKRLLRRHYRKAPVPIRGFSVYRLKKSASLRTPAIQ
ncbi:MAG: ArnT family glycosyltransferase [Bradymonadia bacterium]